MSTPFDERVDERVGHRKDKLVVEPSVPAKTETKEAPSAETEEIALEDDPRLSELALHTIRSLHKVNGVVFDQAAEVEALTKVDFIYVKLGLPLGSEYCFASCDLCLGSPCALTVYSLSLFP